MTSTSPAIPPNTAATGSLGPFPTPTHGQPGPGTFTIACSAHIKAAPRTCLEVLLKASEYPAWNRYCRECIIDAQPSDGGDQPKKDNKDKKPKSKKGSKPKAGKPREPVDIPAVPVSEVPEAEPATTAAAAAAAAPGGTNLSTTESHASSTSASSLWSDHQSLPNLVGPEFLRLGTKFTFHVHMDPLSDDSSARNTALEVSRLERIDEVVEKDVAEVVSGSAASLPSAASTVEEQNQAEGVSATTTTKDVKPTDDLSLQNTTDNNKLQLRRTGFRIAWKTRPSLLMPNWMLRCERVQEFVGVYAPFAADDEPETAYQCWETFYGVLAPVVKAAAGSQIMRGFDVWMDGLKKRAEEVEGGRGE